MKIKERFLQKFLHDIAIEQLAEEYSEKGYMVAKEPLVKNKYRADLSASKGSETIIIEVKSGKLTPDKKRQITDLANLIREQTDYKFLVVLATPPKEKKLQIPELQTLLGAYVMEHPPKELTSLAASVRVEEIMDVDIDEISVAHTSILVSGDGVIEIHLRTGSGGVHGDGFEYTERFSFSFNVELDFDSKRELQILNVFELKVDVSAYSD